MKASWAVAPDLGMQTLPAPCEMLPHAAGTASA